MDKGGKQRNWHSRNLLVSQEEKKILHAGAGPVYDSLCS